VSDELVGCRDAWHHLGSMSQEEAMSSYVDELKKVCFMLYLSVSHLHSLQ